MRKYTQRCPTQQYAAKRMDAKKRIDFLTSPPALIAAYGTPYIIESAQCSCRGWTMRNAGS